MHILGISAFYHDSAAVLLKDGQVVCAAEEERFSRKKHDNSFPFRAVNFCLKKGGINVSDIDAVAYYEKPLLKFERILETFLDTYPLSFKPFLKGMPEWLSKKINVESIIRKDLKYKGKIYYIPHHLSHASAAFYTSGFKTSAILSIDGVGEYQTTALFLGDKGKIKVLEEINFPDSLGLFYATFTSFLGFKVNNDEYKVMGLAAYGEPKMVDKVKKIINIKEDGSFKLDQSYFYYKEGFRMYSDKFIELFGPPRKKGTKILKKHKNLAASFQKVTEEVYLKTLRHLYDLTKKNKVCVSGGVALNSLANGKIYKNTPFKKVHILGSAGDNGASLGAALFVSRMLKKEDGKRLKSLYLGSSYTNTEIKEILEESRFKYRKLSEEKLFSKVAKLLKKGKVIGIFQGRMEFGPRALGARSILARTWPRKMKDRVNEIKKREQFRPFAASCLQEMVHEYFETPEKKHLSPYMNFVFKVKPDKKKMLEAVVHEDGTCRVQTVSKENGWYYHLLKYYYKETQIPLFLNTSFNLAGEPIVEKPQQALYDFENTSIDYLVMGDFLVKKS